MAWDLKHLIELDLAWCVCLGNHALLAVLPKAPGLRSLSVRGLPCNGMLEMLLDSSPMHELAAIDLGFCQGLKSETVLALAQGSSRLTRCNLRAAEAVSARVYNQVGELMHARTVGSSSNNQQRDVIENRRRPRHLNPREAATFYYLKRPKQ